MGGTIDNDKSDNTKAYRYPSIDKPWMKYYTEEAIQSTPFQGSIYEHVLIKNQNYLKNIALQCFGGKITYKKLFQNMEIAVAALSKSGVHKGQRNFADEFLSRTGIFASDIK